jgi:metallo-beta-lactamase family protein
MAKISFFGGVGTVTGSKYLLEHGGRRVLVDCGLFQGDKELRERNWEDPPFSPGELDAVIITHAHIDHTGYLPRLVRLGYGGPVFTSRGTADLLKILLPDSGRLQEEDAEYRNRHNLTSHTPALPLYDERDARDALDLIQGVSNDKNLIDVCEGFRAGFHVAGHIIGASLVLVEMGETRFLFSGDLGHYDQPIVKDPDPPPPCDYLMVESTYGNRLHGDVDSATQMALIINEAAGRGGPILIPAFAVGRTQEVLYLIRELEDAGRIPILPLSQRRFTTAGVTSTTRTTPRYWPSSDIRFGRVR